MPALAYQADGNQKEIVKALRDAGCSVDIIVGVGRRRGIPDLLVGRNGKTYLLEVKTPKGVLSDEQKLWHAEWRGFPVAVVRTVDEALRAVGLL